MLGIRVHHRLTECCYCSVQKVVLGLTGKLLHRGGRMARRMKSRLFLAVPALAAGSKGVWSQFVRTTNVGIVRARVHG
jgi:hypothetical protein